MPISDSPQVTRVTRSSTRRNSSAANTPKEYEKPKRAVKKVVIIYSSDSDVEENKAESAYRNKKVSLKSGDTPRKDSERFGDKNKTVGINKKEVEARNLVGRISVDKNKIKETIVFSKDKRSPAEDIVIIKDNKNPAEEFILNKDKNNSAEIVLVNDSNELLEINDNAPKITSEEGFNENINVKNLSKETNIKNNFINKDDNSDCNKTVLKLREIQNTIPDSSPTKTTRNPDNNLTPRKKKLDIENVGAVTPPKQQKTEEAENKLFSPSSLFSKLDLNASPTKNETHFEPKKLFQQQPTSFQNARKALHGTLPVQMPGREREHTELRSFIKGHLDNKTSGTLYVSGPPGTGKTASLSTILRQPDIESEFREVYVNCTGIKSSGAIYSRIVKELGLKCSGKNEKDFVSTIENHLRKNHKMILLVLDEIDQLESKKQSVLYTIFEWPSWPNSRLILVGIANALDLTDRILPRLQARCELKPKLMHFAPYTKQQIVTIFTDRLKEAGVLELFQPVALQMLAGKVAAVSGDVRRALDIGRRVIEIVEQKKISGEANSVDLKQVVGVLNSVYGTSNNLDEEDDSFPLQQKIVICTLLLILKKARNKDVTVGKLHEVYKKVCSKRNLLAVDQAEFVGLCSLIETKGIIRVAGRKEPRLHKVNLEWDEEEVGSALKDKQLMSMILQDDSVLGKM